MVTECHFRPLPLDAEIIERNGRPHVKLRENGKSVFYPLTKDRAKYIKQLSTWYAKFRNSDGTVQKIPLSPVKAAAEAMYGELVRHRELGKAGAVNPFESHAMTDLATHVEDWRSDLLAKGSTSKHVECTCAMVLRIFRECGFVFPPDLSASKAQSILASWRIDQPNPLEGVPGEFFTKRRTAELFGMSLPAVSAFITRRRLATVGSGKALRYPRATLEAIAAVQCRGISIRTMNAIIVALRAFGSWMVADKRLPDNPFASLTEGNAEADPRHQRRALDESEAAQLIRAAENSERAYRGLSGQDRAALYVLALSTGFRSDELASLTPLSFALDGSPPSVLLPGSASKNGRTTTQPIPTETAKRMRLFLIGRSKCKPVWPGTWHERSAEMILRDIEEAGIPREIETANGPLVIDFHALRHTYFQRLDQTGASVREAMQLARHSDPKLTLKVYGKAGLSKLGEVVRQLPIAGAPHVPPHVPEFRDEPVQSGTNREGCTGAEIIRPDEGSSENALEMQFFGENEPLEESAPSRTRTYNPLIKSQLLCQLSYRGIRNLFYLDFWEDQDAVHFFSVSNRHGEHR